MDNVDFAFSLLKKFEPHSIFDMSLVTAAIRPSGASYRDNLIAHKPNHNPSPQIDELLKENNGYLIYQEDVIAFLQEVCGLSGSAADSIRRGIARKKPEILERAMPDVLAGYCRNSSQPPDVAKKEAMTFLKIIEDASSYMFGKNHSIAYCLIGYLCAYLRFYYPGEFIMAYLNNAANQDDISSGIKLAKERGIKMLPIKFGHSGAHYVYDRELNAIYKGIASVKYMNPEIADKLLSLKTGTYDSFLDVLKDITFLDTRQTEILINLDFFSEYGTSSRLLKMYRAFKEVFKNGEARSISPSKIGYELVYTQFCECYTKSGALLKSFRITDMDGLLRSLFNEISNDDSISEMSIKEKMEYQKEYLGYSDLVTGNEEDRKKIIINGLFPVKRKSDGEIFAYNILSRSIGSGKESRLTIFKNTFKGNEFKEGDIIEAGEVSKNSRGYWCLLNYRKIS